MSETPSTARTTPLPPQQLRLMGDTDEQFRTQAASLARLCRRMGLRPDGEVLDVGCGVGRLAVGLIEGEDFSGRYVGFDVMRRHVGWARDEITPIAPSYHFRHADVHNDRYNPRGTIDPADFRFPARDGGFDFGVLFSVFTHFYLDDIEHYLRELHRTIRPGGLVLNSWFVFDDESEEHVRTASAYPMAHRLDADTVYNDADDPLRAIAHHERRMRQLVEATGFDLVGLEHGRWKGAPGPEFQDMVLLRRRPDAATPTPMTAGRVARGLARRVRGLRSR